MLRVRAPGSRALRLFTVLPFLPLLLPSRTAGYWTPPRLFPCPDPEAVSPCSCDSYGQVECSFANSSEEIFSAFNDVIWPSTQQLQFFLRGTQGMKNLPEGIFGNVTFQEMFISDTSLETV
ncbi:unnamed protein product, partial [Darwinula stevensoni]